MTDYAITLTKRNKSTMRKIKIRPELHNLYEGSEANNNYHVMFYLNEDVTAAANNDTITITLG